MAGDSSQGTVLPGQVQAVKQGIGISILPDGTINVDASTVTGLMRLNNLAAYNAYVWPGADGTSNQFLKTDGAGNLAWANPAGFAVVSVSSIAPTPQDVGELWYDCDTGTLNVWQDCVGTPVPNWFNVAQPGLPVLPGNTTSIPAFSGGSGTQASPYIYTATTVAPGSTVFIVNEVTITGLAPYQFVPITDLNANINGGRYSFTNNYADAAGTLVFQTVFTDLPSSAPGTSYTAAIRVGYATVYGTAVVTVIAGLTTTAGSISGNAAVGATLTYTTGVASGGTGPYTYTWVWKKQSDASVLQVGGATYVIPASLAGDGVFVELTATDAALATATASTSNYPGIPGGITAISLVSPGSISGTAAVGQTLTYTTGSATGGTAPYAYTWVWKKASDDSVLQTNGATYVIPAGLTGDNVYVTLTATDANAQTASGDTADYPTPPATIAGSGITNAVAPTSIPGTANFAWADGPSNVTSTDCIEFSVNGGAFTQASTPVVDGDTITTQWKTGPAGSCGDAPDGTTITGTLTNGTLTSNFSLLLDKVPDAFTLSPATESISASTVTVSDPSFTVAGINAPAYIWGTFTTTGGTPQYSTDAGVTWTALPTAPGTTTVTNGQTVQIRFTTGPTAGVTEVYNLNVGASVTSKQSSTFTVTVTSSTITGAVAPISIPGTANFAWADGPSNVTSTDCIEFSVNGGAFTQASTAVVDGDTITTQWKTGPAGTCGDAADGTTITGTLTNGAKTTNFSLTLDKVPNAFTLSPATETIATSSVTVSDPSFTVSGINAPAYIWGTFATTGSTPQYSTDAGVTWTALPTAPGTTTVTNGQTVRIRFTTGATAGVTEVYNLDVGASVGSKQSGTFTVTVSSSAITNAVMPTLIPGTANFAWADGADTLSATGCCEFSVDGGTTWGVGPTAVTNATTVTTRWVNNSGSGLCGDAASGTTITGNLTTPSLDSAFSLTLDRIPAAFTLTPATETTTRSTVTTSNPTFTVSGINAPAKIWGSFGAIAGTSPEYSVDGGTTWSSIPAAPSPASTVSNGQTVTIRFTTGTVLGNSVYTLSVGASSTPGQFSSGTFTVTVATAPFPLTTLTAPTTIPGVSGPFTWADGARNITGTGCIEFSKNGGAYTQASTAFVDGDQISLNWVTSPACNGAADGTTITGTITDGIYTNDFSLTIDRAPTAFTFTDLTVQPISSQRTSDVVTLAGTNATTYVTKTAGTLTTVEASINGGAWTAIPATGTTMPINIGETIQIRGTTGASLSTAYTATISIGGVTDVWSVTTAAVAPSVSTPSIVTPASNATGIVSNPTLTGSAYTPNGGAGAQNCASWQLVPGDATTRTSTTGDAWDVVGSPWTFPTSTATGSVFLSHYSAGGKIYKLVRGTGNAVTVFVSSDNGVSWTKNTPATPPVGNITMNINSNGVICNARPSNSTAYFTTNDGAAWTTITGPTANIHQEFIQVSGTSTLIWSTVSASNQLIYRSTDNGATWTLVHTGVLTDASVTQGVQTLGNVVACRVDSSANGGYWTAVSTDAGLTWSGYGSSLLTLYRAGSDAWWSVDDTVGTIRRSLDGGLTSTQVATYTAGGGSAYMIQGFGAGTNACIFTVSNNRFIPFNTTTYAVGTVSAAVNPAVYASGSHTFTTTSTKILGIAYNSRDNTNWFPYAYDTSVATKAMRTTGVNLSTKYAQNAPVLADNAATGTVDYVSYQDGGDSHLILNAPAAAGWATATSYAFDAAAATPKTVDVTCDTVNLTSYPVVGLTPATTYSARVQYESVDPYTSSWSAWSVFTTA